MRFWIRSFSVRTGEDVDTRSTGRLVRPAGHGVVDRSASADAAEVVEPGRSAFEPCAVEVIAADHDEIEGEESEAVRTEEAGGVETDRVISRSQAWA